nr:hypothetical protein [Jiangella muralis]
MSAQPDPVQQRLQRAGQLAPERTELVADPWHRRLDRAHHQAVAGELTQPFDLALAGFERAADVQVRLRAFGLQPDAGEGVIISDRAGVVRLGAEAGLDAELGRRVGVSGVPTFLIAGRYLLTGALRRA